MGPEGRHAIVIGGGASGVLLAFQLLKTNPSDLRVTLIEKRPEIGRGLAYHAGNPEHLLNVRVTNMSALPDDPELSGTGYVHGPPGRCVRILIASFRGKPTGTISPI